MKNIKQVQVFLRWLKDNHLFGRYKRAILQQISINQSFCSKNSDDYFKYDNRISNKSNAMSIIIFLLAHKPNHVISSSFLWRNSKEGYYFWSNVDLDFHKFYNFNLNLFENEI